MKLLLLAAAAACAGCTTFSPDAGFTDVARLTHERTGATPAWQRGDDEATRQRTRALLAEPLTAEAAVQLALLQNPALQARFEALALADAQRVRTGRLPNPMFSFEHLRGGGITEIERSFGFDLMALVTLPLNQRLGERAQGQAQLEAAQAALATATATRRAWVEAVAAHQRLESTRLSADAADAAAELVRRLQQVGNVSALAAMRARLFQEETAQALQHDEQAALAARERLGQWLGVDDPAAWRLPERLPDLPALAPPAADAEQLAMRTRLDVRLAAQRIETLGDALGLTRATRLVHVVEVGVGNRSETGEPRRGGYGVTLELPLFDAGSVRTAEAEARLRGAEREAQAVAQRARAEVRVAAAAYARAHATAVRWRDERVPLRQRIAKEQLLRYNGMLIGPVELLADAREQVDAVGASIDAQRDAWLAQAELQAALVGGGAR